MVFAPPSVPPLSGDRNAAPEFVLRVAHNFHERSELTSILTSLLLFLPFLLPLFPSFSIHSVLFYFMSVFPVPKIRHYVHFGILTFWFFIALIINTLIFSRFVHLFGYSFLSLHIQFSYLTLISVNYSLISFPSLSSPLLVGGVGGRLGVSQREFYKSGRLLYKRGWLLYKRGRLL